MHCSLPIVVVTWGQLQSKQISLVHWKFKRKKMKYKGYRFVYMAYNECICVSPLEQVENFSFWDLLRDFNVILTTNIINEKILITVKLSMKTLKGELIISYSNISCFFRNISILSPEVLQGSFKLLFSSNFYLQKFHLWKLRKLVLSKQFAKFGLPANEETRSWKINL